MNENEASDTRALQQMVVTNALTQKQFFMCYFVIRILNYVSNKT